MLESLINERRHNDENNASMLETMQQAIIRVLDRIDALEIAQQDAGRIAGYACAPPPRCSRPHATRPMPRRRLPADADDAAGAPDVHAAALDADTPAMRAAAVPSPTMAHATPTRRHRRTPAPQPRVSRGAASISMPPSAIDATPRPKRTAMPRPPQRSIEVLRHDFIADAHRAKLKAASKPDTAGRAGDLARRRAVGEASRALPAKAARAPSIFASARSEWL